MRAQDERASVDMSTGVGRRRLLTFEPGLIATGWLLNRSRSHLITSGGIWFRTRLLITSANKLRTERRRVQEQSKRAHLGALRAVQRYTESLAQCSRKRDNRRRREEGQRKVNVYTSAALSSL